MKARGTELLAQFLSDPMHLKIPLSAGLVRVAQGWVDDETEIFPDRSSATSEGWSEAELLEPMPLPGRLDTFDYEEEMFE